MPRSKVSPPEAVNRPRTGLLPEDDPTYGSGHVVGPTGRLFAPIKRKPARRGLMDYGDEGQPARPKGKRTAKRTPRRHPEMAAHE